MVKMIKNSAMGGLLEPQQGYLEISVARGSTALGLRVLQ